MKQIDIFVLDKCEITVDKKNILHVDTNWEGQKVLNCALLSKHVLKPSCKKDSLTSSTTLNRGK